MTFEGKIISNSKIRQSKLMRPAKIACEKPDTGVTINKKGAYYLIKDSAEITVQYLVHLCYGSYTDAIKELTFYQNLDQTKALKNITIPQLAFIINYIKEYVTNRGGKFVYFHVDSFPAELYDAQLNPFYYNISPYMLLESNLHEAIPRHLEWKRWDGIHFDKNGHKWLANYLIKQLENSDFIHILR